MFEGVLGSLPGHVRETLPMELKAEVFTTGTVWLHSVSEQLEELLQKSARVQNEISVGARGRGKLMHPECGLGRFVIVPGYLRRVEKIEVPSRGLESQSLREQIADLVPLVPDMGHRKALKGFSLRVRPLEAVVSHHGEPDSETLQMVREFLEKFADKTLSVDAHRSRRREDRNQPDRPTGIVEVLRQLGEV